MGVSVTHLHGRRGGGGGRWGVGGGAGGGQGDGDGEAGYEGRAALLDDAWDAGRRGEERGGASPHVGVREPHRRLKCQLPERGTGTTVVKG